MIILFFLLLISNVYADNISAPPPLQDEPPAEQAYLNSIYTNIHSPEILSSVPTSTPNEGLLKLYYSADARLYAYINSLWKYVSIENNKFGDGTNYSQFESDGTLLFVGDATVWEDIRVSGLAMRTNATAPDLIAFAPATTNLLTYGFDGNSTTEQTYFAIQLPHGYKEGTVLHPHVHWTPTDTNTGTVVWSLEYTWANIDGTFSAPTTISTSAMQAGGIAWVHKQSDFDDITGTGKTVSSMIMCRLFRNPASDTYEHDVALLEVDFHYEMDTIGSREELTK